MSLISEAMTMNEFEEYENVLSISEYLRLDSKRYDGNFNQGDYYDG